MTTVSYHPNSLNLSLHGLQSFGNPGELRRHPAMKIFDRLRDRHPGESVASDCSALGTPHLVGPFRAHGLQIIPTVSVKVVVASFDRARYLVLAPD